MSRNLRRTSIAAVVVGLLGASCARTAPAASTESRPASETVPAASAPASATAAHDGRAAPFVPIAGAARPLPGILTGGQPTPDQLATAARLGYRTVVTLRPEGEPGSAGERERVESLGMRFVEIPIAGAADLTESNARILADALSGEASKPAIVHCGTGNRAGALLALEAYYVEGRSADEALARGKEAGLTTLEAAVRERLESAAR